MLGDWPDWSADCMLMLSHLHLIVVTIRPSKHFELIIQYLTNQMENRNISYLLIWKCWHCDLWFAWPARATLLNIFSRFFKLNSIFEWLSTVNKQELCQSGRTFYHYWRISEMWCQWNFNQLEEAASKAQLGPKRVRVSGTSAVGGLLATFGGWLCLSATSGYPADVQWKTPVKWAITNRAKQNGIKQNETKQPQTAEWKMTKHDLKFDVHGKSGVPLARHFPARPRFHFHFPISLPHLFIFPAAAEAEAEGSPPRAATLFLISAKIVVYTMSLRMSRIVVPRPRSSVLLWQWLLQVFVAAAASICGRLRGFWGSSVSGIRVELQ